MQTMRRSAISGGGPTTTAATAAAAVLTTLSLTSSLVAAQSDNMHKLTATIKGHVQIGALFPVHRKGETGKDRCGEIWEQYGIQRTEIALKTVDEINNDPSLLADITLGIQVRDECWTERIAMQQAIEFIRVILSTEETKKSGVKTSKEEDVCTTDVNERTNLAAVIGPGSSSTTIATHNLLQVFHVPQVGYSATSKDLSNMNEFKYYMRLVPSDKWQAKVMVEIVKKFNWTHVAVVYSEGNYGEKGYEELKEFIDLEDDTCIAMSEKISSQAPRESYIRLLNKIAEFEPKPTAVICFCEGDTSHNIFQTIKDEPSLVTQQKWKFQWIGSESWSDRRDVVAGVEREAAGSLILRLKSPRVPDFDPYYWSLTPSTNTRNPWFTEFWMQKFRCRLPVNKEKHPELQRIRQMYNVDCNVQAQNLTQDFVPDTKLSQVINSIYTVAYALDRMKNEACSSYTGKGLCPAMRQAINGSKLYEMMKNVTFTDKSSRHGRDRVYFDEFGDPPPRYDVINYQGRTGGYKPVGKFYDDQTGDYVLELNVSLIKWYSGDFGLDYVPDSKCSQECPIGHIRSFATESKCCWTCVTCAKKEYVKSLTKCEACHEPCLPMSEEYLRWTDPGAVFAVSFSCLGIAATIFVMIVFIRYNHTPLVKATTRELTYMILVAIIMCYGITFVIVAKPTNLTCYAVRMLPGTTFALIYGALLIKTNRIARILAQDKKKIMTKRPRFLDTTSQVVMTWILVAIELCIVIAYAVIEPPEAYHPSEFKNNGILVLTCRISDRAFLAPYGWDLLLIAMCTVYAVKTRNVPSNFNEAKFIGFTMYTTCIIWIAFIMIYFGSPQKALTMCVSFSLSATVALVLLFGQKLYIILRHPEKNVRQSTDPNIRVHIPQSIDQNRKSMKGKLQSSQSTVVTSAVKNNGSTKLSLDQRATQRRTMTVKEEMTLHKKSMPDIVENAEEDVAEDKNGRHDIDNWSRDSSQSARRPGAGGRLVDRSAQTQLTSADFYESNLPEWLDDYGADTQSGNSHEEPKHVKSIMRSMMAKQATQEVEIHKSTAEEAKKMLTAAVEHTTDTIISTINPESTPTRTCRKISRLADGRSAVQSTSPGEQTRLLDSQPELPEKPLSFLDNALQQISGGSTPQHSHSRPSDDRISEEVDLTTSPQSGSKSKETQGGMCRQQSDTNDSGIWPTGSQATATAASIATPCTTAATITTSTTTTTPSTTQQQQQQHQLQHNSSSFDGESGVLLESSKQSSLSSKQSSGKSHRNLIVAVHQNATDANPFHCLLSEQGLRATELTETTLV